MLRANTLQSLFDLPGPVLTVYLNTNEAGASQGVPAFMPAYLTRLENHIHAIASTVPSEDQQSFRTQVERVQSYLLDHPMPYRGTVIFAGPGVWELLPLQVETEDEIQWGTPALVQLLWLVAEHRPYGVALIGRKGAQIFLWRIGELLHLEAKEFELGESKQKEMGPMARPGVRMSHGINRDVFEHHVSAQYKRFYGEIAERIEHWRTAEHMELLFLVGLSDMVRGVRDELPTVLQKDVVLVEEDLGWMSRSEIQKRIAPMVASREQERESKLVNELLSSDRAVTQGIDETLAQLQQGRLRRIVVSKGFSADGRQCLKCGQVNRTADPVCPACNGERKAAGLRAILPILARRHHVAVEIVSGEAARRLQQAEGIGGWFREFEKKEYSSAASSGI